MIEQVFGYSLSEDKLIEKIVNDDNVMLNHMILNQGDSLPLHHSNSNVYMVVVKGTMTIKLGEQDAHKYTIGDILNIPYNILMDVRNEDENQLEFFVIKAPSPKMYKEE